MNVRKKAKTKKSGKADLNREGRQKVFETASEFCFDIAKLVFAGIILSGIMLRDIEGWLLFGLGAGAVVVMILVGYLFLIKSIKK